MDVHKDLRYSTAESLHKLKFFYMNVSLDSMYSKISRSADLVILKLKSSQQVGPKVIFYKFKIFKKLHRFKFSKAVVSSISYFKSNVF